MLLSMLWIFFNSDLRQIPDNQEVFAHPVTDQSIIIEILEYVDKNDEEAIRLVQGEELVSCVTYLYKAYLI